MNADNLQAREFLARLLKSYCGAGLRFARSKFNVQGSQDLRMKRGHVGVACPVKSGNGNDRKL